LARSIGNGDEGAEMAADDGEITIRPLGDEDRERVAELAQLDTKRPLEGRLLGASVGGRLVAALAIESGESVADPFLPSAHARAMLELRASQLTGRGRNQNRGRLLRRRGRRARAALPASPPGAGGRLLALARRS
jgi:hypothetical protein